MRTFLAVLCVVVSGFSAAIAGEAVDLLADGKLDAWRGYKQEGAPANWKVEEGVLTRTGDGGDLITKTPYQNFDFEFEWKISPGGNSGVIYLCNEEEDHSFMTGPEYQVIDNPGWKLENTANTAAGALYELYKPEVDAAKPAGEWNTGRIVIHDRVVEHWLNGQKLLTAELGSDDWNARVAPTKFAAWKKFGTLLKGHIALQDHGAQVWYRNLKITNLDGEAASEPQASATTPRILLVTQSAGFQHSTVTRKPGELSHCERVMNELALKSRAFRLDCTQDVANDFTPELVKNYDVVMFFTTGDLPIPEATREWFLNDWLKTKGHAFLGVHAAADTYHNYQPFWDMIGGTFNGHPWTSESTVTIKVNDPDHPASQPWGTQPFTITDEIYQFKNWQPEKVRVLMSMDVAKSLPEAKADIQAPYQVPILWVKNYGAGRVMHMSLGHREDVWSNPTYQESLLGGIRWLLGQEEGDATPNPEVSAEEEAAAKAAVEASGKQAKKAA